MVEAAMVRAAVARSSAVLLVLSLLGLAGCAGSDHMRPLENGAARASELRRAPSDKALVVFVRPGSQGAGMLVTLLDDNGTFLGDAPPNSYFARSFSPGAHTFVAWAANTSALRAELAAGKTYFVLVDVKMGAMSARVDLKAVTPGSERWSEHDAWLGDATGLEPIDDEGQAALEERRIEVEEQIRRARMQLERASPDELEQQSLRPSDGI